VVRFGDDTPTPVAQVSITDLAPSDPCILDNAAPGTRSMPFAVGDVTGDGNADIYVLLPNVMIVSQGRTFAAPVTVQPFAASGDRLGDVFDDPWLLDVNGDSKADLLLSASGGFVATLFNASDAYGW
jgi:hypothetical protein